MSRARRIREVVAAAMFDMSDCLYLKLEWMCLKINLKVVGVLFIPLLKSIQKEGSPFWDTPCMSVICHESVANNHLVATSSKLVATLLCMTSVGAIFAGVQLHFACFAEQNKRVYILLLTPTLIIIEFATRRRDL